MTNDTSSSCGSSSSTTSSSTSSCSSSSSDSVSSEFNKNGNVLISDQYNNRVIETTPAGKIVWKFGHGPNSFTQASPIGVTNALRVPKARTLIVGAGIEPGITQEAPLGVVDNRVMLVSKGGNIIWQYGKFGETGSGFNRLNRPVHAVLIHKKKHRHSNILKGNVLISDEKNNRVIEVNQRKKIVWEYPVSSTEPENLLAHPNSAQKLDNGNVLIADKDNNRAIEVNTRHQVVATYTAECTVGKVSFASRLPNGNTLLTDNDNFRIVEVNSSDNIVWNYYTNAEENSIDKPYPTRGIRLKNGDTLVSNQYNNRVARVNKTDAIVDGYGLPLTGGTGIIGDNAGYHHLTTQLGLYSPHDAKIIGDYTGITNPNHAFC